MRPRAMLFAVLLPAAAIAAPAHFDVGDTHVIVIRPLDSWDPNQTTAEYSMDGLRSKNFGFRYMDASGATIVPSSGGLFRERRSTPLSDETFKIMAASGFGNKGSHVYFVSGAVTLRPTQMGDFSRAQNQLYKASVLQDGDPTTLGSRIAAKNFATVMGTAAVANFGADRFGANLINGTQYGSLYADISRLTGGASAAILPVPLPEFDFSGFATVDIRRVTDNAGHMGEILIAYRNPKTAASEQSALAQAIAIAGGVGTTVSEVEAARAQHYAQRLAIWTECQATTACMRN